MGGATRGRNREQRIADALAREDAVEIRATAGRGNGLFALRDFRAGERITSFKGRIVPYDESQPQTDAMLCDRKGRLVANGRGTHVIIPDMSVPGAHIANHSCNPNATLEMNATRPIAAGEEISTFYGWIRSSGGRGESQASTPCLCGSTPCFGTIGLVINDQSARARYVEVARHHRNWQAIGKLIDGLALLTNARRETLAGLARIYHELGGKAP